MATMQKWQMEHFEDKVKRQFNPLIEDQELLIKQYRTEGNQMLAVDKLAKKMGADKIINDFRKAEKNLADARASAITFFDKKKPKDKELNYNFRNRDDRLELSDCEEQLRDWASNLVDKEIEKRPEGSKLAHLKELKCKAMDTIKECGSPEALAVALDKVSNKIGITWNTDIKAIPQIK